MSDAKKNVDELTEKEIVATLDKDNANNSSKSKEPKKKIKQVKKKSKLKGLKSEYKRISWPSRKEATGSTIAVLVVSVIMCVIIAGVDYLIQNGLNLLFSIGA